MVTKLKEKETKQLYDNTKNEIPNMEQPVWFK
jgi:hypothetical protein